MGFALWIEHDTAWCVGTHEYRPMGVAVIAATSLFSARDFHPRRPAPAERSAAHFRGLFASLPDVNFYLQRTRPAASGKLPVRPSLRRQLSIIHNVKK